MWTILYFHRCYRCNPPPFFFFLPRPPCTSPPPRTFSTLHPPATVVCDDTVRSIIHLYRRNRAVSRAKQNGVATRRDPREWPTSCNHSWTWAKFARANDRINGPCYATRDRGKGGDQFRRVNDTPILSGGNSCLSNLESAYFVSNDMYLKIVSWSM